MRIYRPLLKQFSSLAILCAFLSVPAFAHDAEWRKELASWREQSVADLLKPDGWLSLAGLEWLQAGANSFGSAADNKIHLAPNSPAHIGVLRVVGEIVKLLPPSGGFPPDFRIA